MHSLSGSLLLILNNNWANSRETALQLERIVKLQQMKSKYFIISISVWDAVDASDSGWSEDVILFSVFIVVLFMGVGGRGTVHCQEKAWNPSYLKVTWWHHPSSSWTHMGKPDRTTLLLFVFVNVHNSYCVFTELVEHNVSQLLLLKCWCVCVCGVF